MNVTCLMGKTLIKVDGLESGDDTVDFHCSDGSVFRMWHRQSCCESVAIEDVCGDVSDLLESPIVRAEEPSSLDGFEEMAVGRHPPSFTWTFYILGTAKGTVTIRWFGCSNGYYSEAVDFGQVKAARS